MGLEEHPLCYLRGCCCSVEFHVRWNLGVLRQNKTLSNALLEPLAAGALFYYSVILVAEGIFRLEMYPELAQRWQARTLKVIAIFLVLPFLGYLLRDVESPLGTDGFRIQSFLGVVSLAFAICVHLFISRLRAAPSQP